MYHAKRDAGSQWRVYADGMHDPSRGTTTLDELRLHHQPVVTPDRGSR
jgi:hypothetical protein